METSIQAKLQIAQQHRFKMLLLYLFFCFISLDFVILALMMIFKQQQVFDFFQWLGLVNKKNSINGFAIFAAFAAAFFFYIQSSVFSSRFAVRFKNSIIPLLLQDKYSNFRYSAAAFVPEQTYLQSGHSLFEFNGYGGEDLLQGDYDGVGVEISQLYISYKSRAKNSKTNIIFEGDFIVISTQKMAIDAKVEVIDGILDDKFTQGMGTSVANKDNSIIQYEKHKLELNPVQFFRSYFSVYTDDVKEAQRLITPQLADYLTEKAKNKQLIYLSLHPEAVYLSMPTKKDFLKISLFSPLNERLLASYQSDLEEKMAIVETVINLLPKRINSL